MKIPHISINSLTSSHASASASSSSKTKAQGTIDKINNNLDTLRELQHSLSLLTTKRAANSADPLIQKFATDAIELNNQTFKATENADAILKQLKKGKLNHEHAGPHHNLLAATDTLIANWESLKEGYDGYRR
ncbi:hypothetical protein Bresa_02580|uniref:Uncharacterized protein n=1 Tax=Brenneria salicis ATCC 15712 = DSM 30166 TaxID=714314 RepID=A0A366IBM1_9GAMM|nr:hypothetical protein [Brenneria salicis]NMN92301.1 hypothetical protein [Brenneria salicis ATCC 15712 = DSM 30166]RBP67640.1 hypothetical protein DES54_101160 [Brenneria salicis ATCC 15712 = DSM 30166]RLM32385.1 hypothetical protein BHG07_00710 [Brenneria salicis ATCC 15712 = DSM 30166]